MLKVKNKLIEKLVEVRDRTRVKVRFNDTDAMGIVHFKNYVVFILGGRTKTSLFPVLSKFIASSGQ